MWISSLGVTGRNFDVRVGFLYRMLMFFKRFHQIDRLPHRRHRLRDKIFPLLEFDVDDLSIFIEFGRRLGSEIFFGIIFEFALYIWCVKKHVF
jgi:hypothetical protein